MLLLLFIGSTGFQTRKVSGWSAIEIKKADTARKWKGIDENEKDLFLFLNLARIYPDKFIRLYLDQETVREHRSNERSYVRSLIRDLRKLKSLPPLEPNENLMAAAACFSKEKARTGKMGHNRKHCKGDWDFGGECLSYTWTEDGQRHILNLLIDAGVPSLGHRRIMLSEGYTHMGVALGPHKRYGVCAVLDFK